MNRVTQLLGVRYPIVQGGMVWCSGWRLAASVSNAGGLGLLGAGSMNPDLLLEHIQKVKGAATFPFGVNIPLMFHHSEEMIELVIREKVPVVFTSAGSPKKYTSKLKEHGIKVVHVVSSAMFAEKSQDAGVDAVVAEGFEAGGHNGRDETTTLTLVELVRNRVSIPVIAAGGIATGAAMAAVQVLGAEGVQIGSLFAASAESSASMAFKKRVVDATEGETVLTLKKLAPVRMLKNEFCNRVLEMENSGSDVEALKAELGRGRSRNGIFEGDLNEGELEIGQSSAHISCVRTVNELFNQLIEEYTIACDKLDNKFV
jgi:enoyl-[acyl-carrier protein] reductase II